MERLQRAADLMQHRGPDDRGYSQGADYGMAHCRLSIIDLSADGRQPMVSDDGNVSLIYNGEIYNFLELRRQLGSQVAFKSRTDSEVILRGYQAWGIDELLRRLNGMFAFAIWDQHQEMLFLARDRCGKKPLYYCVDDDNVAFASTLECLLGLIDRTPEVSLESIAYFLTYLSVPAPHTVFKGISKLEPATFLTWRKGESPRLQSYWQIDLSAKQQQSEQDWIDRIDQQLRCAVRDRLMSDVPLGAFLSGGVDSSLVAAMMADQTSEPICTISVGFSEDAYNELPFARMVAKRWKTDHHEHIVRPASLAKLPAIIGQFGEPFADHSAIPSYYLAQVARQHLTVVLTGDGGDEAFAGYATARLLWHQPWLRFLAGWPMRCLAGLARARDSAGGTFARRVHWVSQVFSKRRGNYVFDPVGSRSFRFLRNDLFGSRLLDAMSQPETDALYTQPWQEQSELSWLDRSLLLDLTRKLPNTFLTKVDVATMAHSLEARCPLLDYRVLELSAAIPHTLKVKNGHTKYLLKKVAERYVPKEVIYRKKQGFSVPVAKWFRGDLSALARRVLLSREFEARELFQLDGVKRLLEEHMAGKADHGQHIWTMLVLEIWFRMFVDKQLQAHDDLSDLITEQVVA